MLKRSRCVHYGATLIRLKATPSFIPLRMSPCQEQNNGAQPQGTEPFACSCLPFPGPQKPIKGALMEDDKRQPTPVLSVYPQPSPLSLPSQKNCPVFRPRSNIPPLFSSPPPPSLRLRAWWREVWEGWGMSKVTKDWPPQDKTILGKVPQGWTST